MISNLWLISYLLAWIVFFVFYQRKRKIYDAGSFILSTYIVYAFCSWLLFNEMMENKEIKLFPFIYLFIMLLLSSSTVFNFNVTRIDKIQKPNKMLFFIVASFFIIPSLALSITTITTLQDGISMMIIDSTVGKQLYEEALESGRDSGSGGISNLAAILSSAFYNIGVLFTFYYLTLPKRSKLLLLALILSTFVGLLSSVSSGQRTGTVLRLMTIIATYFAFKTFFSSRIRKVAKTAGILLVIIVSFPIVLITMSRFGPESAQGTEEGASESVLRYVGQENLNFNYYGLDDGGIRYGDRTAPLFKKMLGFKGVPDNFWQRRSKYPHLKMDDNSFYTFVGDFTIDYGPFFAFILFLVFTPFFHFATRVKNRRIKFHQLILVHFVICVCVQGGMYLFSFSDTAGNLQIIVIVIAYYLFKIDYKYSLYKNNAQQFH